MTSTSSDDPDRTRYLFEHSDEEGRHTMATIGPEQRAMIDEMWAGEPHDATAFDLTVDEGARSFVATIDGAEVGYVPFDEVNGRIVLLSTAVLPEYRGRGIGTGLTRRVLDTLREQGRRVTVMCPVFRTFIERNPEYAELLDAAAPGIARPHRA